MLSKRLFIFDKFISSIVDKELSIIIKPITVPIIPSFNSISATKNPLSTISYSLDFNCSWKDFLFEIFDNEIGEVFNARVGNILKPHKDVKMPSKSKLDQTRSDIFGDLNYKIGKNLKLGYSFSYDRDLDFSNLDSLNLDASINNLFTNFNYYTENNDFGDEETLRNKTRYKIDNNTNLIFTTAKGIIFIKKDKVLSGSKFPSL